MRENENKRTCTLFARACARGVCVCVCVGVCVYIYVYMRVSEKERKKSYNIETCRYFPEITGLTVFQT